MSTETVFEELLAEVEGSLAEAEYDLRALEDHVRQLQAERYGLQVALARVRYRAIGPPLPTDDHAIPVDEAAPAPASASTRPASWGALSRAEAVEAVLAEADTALTRIDVVERLAQAGRSKDDADAVSAALAYLLRTGRAIRVGRGQWVQAVAGADAGDPA